MGHYRTILLATDLSDETKTVAKKANDLRNHNQASLHIIHVIEPLHFAYGGDIPMDFTSIQGDIEKQTQTNLRKLGKQLHIPIEHQHSIVGHPETEIHKKAQELHADLIVIGSHGRHGLALLLGSTANGVLHGATCDVLAVRVGQQDHHPR